MGSNLEHAILSASIGVWERERRFEDKSPEMGKNKGLFQESKKELGIYTQKTKTLI